MIARNTIGLPGRSLPGLLENEQDAHNIEEYNWTSRAIIARAARATARVARTIPSCQCYTSPCIVRATLAVALEVQLFSWQSFTDPVTVVVMLDIQRFIS